MFLLSETCPLVSAQGQTVLKEEKPYLWHHNMNGGKTMFFEDETAVEIIIKDPSKVLSASRVENFAPCFIESMRFVTGMVNENQGVEGILDGLEMSSCDEEGGASAPAQAPASSS
jgi:hypothetical protein